jgi:hypothetical protein
MPRAQSTMTFSSTSVSRLAFQKWIACSVSPDGHQKPEIRLRRTTHPQAACASMPPV